MSADAPPARATFHLTVLALAAYVRVQLRLAAGHRVEEHKIRVRADDLLEHLIPRRTACILPIDGNDPAGLRDGHHFLHLLGHARIAGDAVKELQPARVQGTQRQFKFLPQVREFLVERSGGCVPRVAFGAHLEFARLDRGDG